MSQNCPYCPEDPNQTSSSWGMSYWGWEQARENHDQNHCCKCSCCGQYKLKEEYKPNYNNQIYEHSF